MSSYQSMVTEKQRRTMQMRGSLVLLKIGIVRLMITLTFALLTVPLPTEARQASTKVYSIGFLAFGHRPASDSVAASPLAVFRQALRELGYAEGRNLVIEERWAETGINRLPILAAELVRHKVDVIVASGASAVRAAKRIWATNENNAGQLYQPKTRVEGYLEKMRLEVSWDRVRVCMLIFARSCYT